MLASYFIRRKVTKKMLHRMKRGTVDKLKRANGSGTYWWNDKKKYYVSQISYWDDEGLLKYKTKVGAKTEYEARSNIELLKESLKEPIKKLDCKTTIEETIANYIEEKSTTVWLDEVSGNPTVTLDHNISYFNKLKTKYPYILKTKVIKLLPADLQKFVNSEVADKLNRKSIEKILGLITSSLKWFKKHNPAYDITPFSMVEIPPKYKGNEKNVRAYTEEELRQLSSNMLSSQFKHIWLLLLGTGMRPSELLGLRFDEDIDFKNKRIYIRHNWDSKYKTLKTTKTKDQRVLVMEAAIEKILLSAKAIADKYNSPWVCCNTCGVKRNLGIPYSEVFLSKKWRDTVALPSGIDVTALYSLRHTFGTLALKYGRDKQSVGATLGHKYESTTNVYIDIDEKMLIELQETSTNIVDQKLNEMFLLK